MSPEPRRPTAPTDGRRSRPAGLATLASVRILITGSARAIGAATAAELSGAGHEVIATARDVSLLDGLDVAMRLPLDVTDEASVATALDQAGELDAIVNNAAVSGKGPMEAFPDRAPAGHVRDQHLRPPPLVQRVLPQWRSRGSGVVVNVSSVQGRVSSPLEGPYSGTKHALEAISESLHYELGHFGIRMVIIQPGYIAPGDETGRRRRRQRRLPRAVGPVGGDRREGHRARTAGRGRSWWRRPSAAPSRTRPHRCGFRSGEDAVAVLSARAQLDDTAFESAMRRQLDVTW